jgi:hypothetical protein
MCGPDFYVADVKEELAHLPGEYALPTTIYVSSYYYICVLHVSPHTNLYMCPHTTIYVSSFALAHLQVRQTRNTCASFLRPIP